LVTNKQKKQTNGGENSIASKSDEVKNVFSSRLKLTLLSAGQADARSEFQAL